MAQVLALDPHSDTITEYAFAFRKKFIFDDPWPDHLIWHLSGSQVVQPDVDDHIIHNDITYITGVGHGLYGVFTGHLGEVIWDSVQDLTFLRGTIVHLLSCQTGALLGREMVDQGVNAFWGYTTDFSVIHEDPPPADKSSDALAEMFFKMDAIIDRGLLTKRSAQEIYDSVSQYVESLIFQVQGPDERAFLLSNYRHLVCPIHRWGDQTAKLD